MPEVSATHEPVLRATNVSHTYGDASIIDGVSLQLHSREIVALVGPSGCGKTTLLRTCAGLLQPTSGAITHGGRIEHGDDLVHGTPSPVGFVFQEPALLSWRRVAGNARLLADPNDGPLVQRLLAVTGLTDHSHKWPHELSGGMKMRLSLVRTLAARPMVLLLDEPFGALDQITRHELHDEFTALHAEHEFAALMVTHAIDEAVYLADRVLVMSGAPGRIVADLAVSFARPRRAALRFSPEFAALCGDIARHLADAA